MLGALARTTAQAALSHRPWESRFQESDLAAHTESPRPVILFHPVTHFWESVLGQSSEMWVKIYIPEFSIKYYV